MKSLLETKWYTKVRIGLIRYWGGFKEITFDEELNKQFPELIDPQVIENIHMTTGMREGLWNVWDKGLLKVYTMPMSAFMWARKDLSWTYYDKFNIRLEGTAVMGDSITRVSEDEKEIQFIVPEGVTKLIDGKVSRVVTRQLHHEVGHFTFKDVKDDYFIKQRLLFEFYKDLFFHSGIFDHDSWSTDVTNRWLFIIRRFFEFTQRLDEVDPESISLYNVRRFQNRTEILFKSFKGFIGEPFDITYMDFVESVLRRIIPIDETVINIISDSIEEIYKRHWKGSYQGARIHKRNKFYQELFYPSEIFANMVEGRGRNMSNQIYSTLAENQLKKY